MQIVRDAGGGLTLTCAGRGPVLSLNEPWLIFRPHCLEGELLNEVDTGGVVRRPLGIEARRASSAWRNTVNSLGFGDEQVPDGESRSVS